MKASIHFFKLSAICLTSFLTACSRHGVIAPIGSWSADSGAKLVMQTNGTFSMTIPPSNRKGSFHHLGRLSGTYTIIDPTHIKFEYSIWDGRLKGASTNQFSLSGDKLSFQESGGQTMTEFHRTED